MFVFIHDIIIVGGYLLVKDGLLMSEVKANESKDDSEMKVNKKVGQWDRIKNILLNLAGLADVYNNNDKYYDKIKKLFDDYNENELSGDMNINLSELFSNDNKVLLDSVTWRIIKSCTQTIIFGPLHQLLTEYFIPNGISMNQLKEVKSKDGWNIKIYFNKNGIIRVVHNRQRNVEYNDSNFILEWQFSMTFDKECKSCIQSQIKSNGIIFNENETNEYKLNVKKILFGGDIIFH